MGGSEHVFLEQRWTTLTPRAAAAHVLRNRSSFREGVSVEEILLACMEDARCKAFDTHGNLFDCGGHCEALPPSQDVEGDGSTAAAGGDRESTARVGCCRTLYYHIWTRNPRFYSVRWGVVGPFITIYGHVSLDSTPLGGVLSDADDDAAGSMEGERDGLWLSWPTPRSS